MYRCLNCQEAIILDDSLKFRYPEWQTLTTTSKKPAASRPTSSCQAQPSKVPSTSLENKEKSSNGAFLSGGKVSKDDMPHSGSSYSQISDPAEPRSLGGNLGHFTTVTGNLFDIICQDAMAIDHPICQECTDKLLDCMDSQLKILEEESEDYRRLVENLTERQNSLDLNSLRMEHSKLQGEERSLRDELARLEAEEEDIEKQLKLEKKELQQVKKEEERLWKVYRDHSRRLLELDQEEQSVQNQLKYTTGQLDKLSKTNIFNLTFHIWHSSHFGTINGFRLGRLPDEQVEWHEINAAWGQTTLLLNSLARKFNLKPKRYELVPFGNFSFVKCLQDSGSKEKELPLYCTGGYKFLGNSKFDAGMVAFLDYLQQLAEEMERRGGFRLPYAMKKDKILDNEREYSVKIQFNSEERWTKAMKCMLTNLKWALAWIASLHT